MAAARWGYSWGLSALMWAGGWHRHKAVILDGLPDFLLPEIHQRPDNSQISLIQICLRGKGMQLPGIQKAHKEDLHRVIMMMGISHIIAALLQGIAVHCPPAEKGAGIARILAIPAEPRSFPQYPPRSW